MHTFSLLRLEQRLAAIDAELTTLARCNLRSDTGAVGYRSNSYKTEFHEEWIQIDFESPHRLDEIVLVPMIRRDALDGFQADGFPTHFRVVAGTAGNPTGQIIATYTDEQEFLPRIAPLSIPCDGVTASWIRMEAERLSLRAYDRQFVFQLSEIMAFSGGKNAALHQSVTSGSNWHDENAWDKRFVVDGFIPYMMDAATGERSVAFVCRVDEEASPMLTVDLGAPTGVSRLHLHAILHYLRSQKIQAASLLHNLPGELLDAIVPDGSRMDGRKICDLKLPRESVIATVLRSDEVLTATGDLTLLSGDRVLIFAHPKAVKKIQSMFLK